MPNEGERYAMGCMTDYGEVLLAMGLQALSPRSVWHSGRTQIRLPDVFFMFGANHLFITLRDWRASPGEVQPGNGEMVSEKRRYRK
jgi:hypothetical protein